MIWALLFSFASFTFAAKVGKVEYPTLRQIEGQATIRQKGEVLKGRLPGQLLREQVLIETEKGRVRVDLSADEFLIVSENSSLLLPGIDWDTGAVEELELIKGSFGVELKRARQVRSGLYRDRVEAGRYIFDFNPGLPQFGATVLSGKLAFRGLETEEYGDLGPGERQSFMGELAEGQIQFDVLLEGRKVARGKLTSKQSFGPKDLAGLQKAFEFGAKKKVGAGAAGGGGKTTSPILKGSVCRDPAGRFNDCAYTCLNNPKGAKSCELDRAGVSCVRRRCLASGVWGDPFTFAKHLAVCDAKVVVKPCDY
ncbi:MAG: hypothetical protein KF767_18020 [Bdellovibrionaceae bacterium]|nr:hypothetical protein [Pseudobdellovibrionaceae bacterium]